MDRHDSKLSLEILAYKNSQSVTNKYAHL
jgi:hypothetical protein